MLSWKVKRFDCNKQAIVDYDILKYQEDFIKKQKKKCVNKEEFSEALRREFMYRFWSRSEHELILETAGDKILLIPWCGCREPMQAAVDVTEDSSFDWKAFAEYHINRQVSKTSAKIDVWDQCLWQWETLINYCWRTRLPYERKNLKFDL